MKMNEVTSNDLKPSLKSDTEKYIERSVLGKKKILFTLDQTLKLRWYECQFLYQQVASIEVSFQLCIPIGRKQSYILLAE